MPARPSPHRPSALRRLVYRAWRWLPPWAQLLFIRRAAPRLTLGVCAVILDAQGRLLLVHHPYRRRAWGLPGGFARRQEQPTETLARELREELGVGATIGPLLCAEVATAAGHLTLYYRAGLVGTPRPDGLELDAYRYVAPPEVPVLLGAAAPAWLRQVQAALARESNRAA